MTHDDTLTDWYRRFLLLLVAAAIFLLTPLELVFTEHVESLVQWTPFIFCGLGLAAVGAVLGAPRQRVVQGACLVLGLVALSSLFGLYEHIEHNVTFEHEIRPSAGTLEIWGNALFGASPILAPGILALGALLALAALYHHPALAWHGAPPPTDARVG